MRTIGISPKVLAPAVGQILVGVVLIVLGLDVEGKTAIATGLGTLAAGYASPPGDVAVDAPSSDELNAEAFAEHGLT